MSSQHIIFATRFSILAPLGKNFQLSKKSKSYEDYKSKLFDPARLKNRLQIFKEITLTSLQHQKTSSAQHHLLVMTSDILPESEHRTLQKLIEEFSEKSGFHAKVMHIASQPESPSRPKAHENIDSCIRLYIQENVDQSQDFSFATVRLDDDDGLASSYCLHLSSLLSKGHYGIAVSYAFGYQGIYEAETKSFSSLKYRYNPKIALGLAFLNKFNPDNGIYDERFHVHNLGRHSRIDEKHPIIVDATFPAYFRTICHYNDSNQAAAHESLSNVSSTKFDTNEFPFITSIALDQAPLDDDWTPSKFTPEKALQNDLTSHINELNKKIKTLNTQNKKNQKTTSTALFKVWIRSLFKKS